MNLLVVEDNPRLTRLLLRALTEEGYHVDHAGDGRAAVTIAQSTPYDVIVLDWMLPELDGLGVCRALRNSGVGAPILMLTARAEVGERIAGLDAGADDYLTKPFDLAELFARIRALSRRVAPTTMKWGSVTVDLATRRATVEGSVVELTARELALLACLLQHVGHAVSRAELLQKVWNTPFDPGSNVVEVHVRNLREKLGKLGKLVETVRGVGYRVSALP